MFQLIGISANIQQAVTGASETSAQLAWGFGFACKLDILNVLKVLFNDLTKLENELCDIFVFSCRLFECNRVG